jgi:hypothetical protein
MKFKFSLFLVSLVALLGFSSASAQAAEFKIPASQSCIDLYEKRFGNTFKFNKILRKLTKAGCLTQNRSLKPYSQQCKSLKTSYQVILKPFSVLENKLSKKKKISFAQYDRFLSFKENLDRKMDQAEKSGASAEKLKAIYDNNLPKLLRLSRQADNSVRTAAILEGKMLRKVSSTAMTIQLASLESYRFGCSRKNYSGYGKPEGYVEQLELDYFETVAAANRYWANGKLYL